MFISGKSMNKIKRVSWLFRVIFQITFVVLPIITVLAWLNASEPLLSIKSQSIIDLIPRGYKMLHPFTTMTKLMGFLVTLIPLSIELFVFYALIKLFRLYEKGEIFALENVDYIRKIGYALLLGQLLKPFYDVLISITLTWNNKLHGGLRIASITFDQTDLGIVLISLLVILVSWIMMEGCKLREEQQLTI
jgi:hypothetical protein